MQYPFGPLFLKRAGLFALFAAGNALAIEPGQTIEPHTLPLSSGGQIRLPDSTRSKRPEVVIFLMADCPIANAMLPEIGRMSRQYADAGVRFTLVHVDRSITRDSILAHAKAFGIGNPVAHDADHTLVKAMGATVTPEAFLFAADGTLAYRGRINDWYQVLGRRTRFPKTHDLRDAIAAVLEGKKVPRPKTEAIGCFIE